MPRWIWKTTTQANLAKTFSMLTQQSSHFSGTVLQLVQIAVRFTRDSEEKVEARFKKVLQDTIDNPIVVVDPTFVQMPTVASYQALQSIILQATFAPVSRFPALAQLFVGLEHRNGSAVAKSSGFGALATTSETTSREYHMEEPRLIILCNDAAGRSNLSSVSAFEKQVAYLVDQSYYLGESWAGATGVNCHSLDLKPPRSQQFSGRSSKDFTSSNY